MNAAGKIFAKIWLKAIRDTLISQNVEFPNIWCFYLTGLQEDPHTLFPRFVVHPDLSIKKTLRGVGPLTVMNFFQSKGFSACRVKDEKEQTSFYFLMVFNLLKIIYPCESKKHQGTSET